MPHFLTTSPVARTLEMSESGVRKLADSGQLSVATVLPNGTRLFDPEAVAKYATQRALQNGQKVE